MTAIASNSRHPALSRLIAFLRSGFLVPVSCAVLLAALAPFAPGLATADNLADLLGNLAPLLVVAVGQTLVLVSGGIDLSATSTIALSSVVGAFVMNGEDGWLKGSPAAVPVAIVAMLLSGAVVGGFNGFAVTRLRMPAFMVTLTTMMFVSGLAILLTHSQNIRGLPDAFVMLGSRLWLALPLAAAVAGATHLLLSRSVFGHWLRAVGLNARTARVSGVPADAVVVGAYVASGVLAAAASVLYTARLETGSPVLGQRLMLDVIGAVVIGGTSLFGGKGRVSWTLSGVLFLVVLDNALNLLGFSHFAIMMAKGGVILAAAFLDTVRNRWLAP